MDNNGSRVQAYGRFIRVSAIAQGKSGGIPRESFFRAGLLASVGAVADNRGLVQLGVCHIILKGNIQIIAQAVAKEVLDVHHLILDKYHDE